jgi:hypothetical protein
MIPSTNYDIYPEILNEKEQATLSSASLLAGLRRKLKDLETCRAVSCYRGDPKHERDRWYKLVLDAWSRYNAIWSANAGLRHPRPKRYETH